MIIFSKKFAKAYIEMCEAYNMCQLYEHGTPLREKALRKANKKWEKYIKILCEEAEKYNLTEEVRQIDHLLSTRDYYTNKYNIEENFQLLEEEFGILVER